LVIARFNDINTLPASDKDASPEALQAKLNAEVDRWGPIIKAAGQFAD
jgi:putative tricarboxylic transport membrane protein